MTRGVERLAVVLPRRPRGPHGEHYCRRCNSVAPPGRRNWCGDECVQLAQIEAGHQGVMRVWLEARDHGVCALCGLDTVALERWLLRLAGRVEEPEGVRWRSRWEDRHPSLTGSRFYRPDARAACAAARQRCRRPRDEKRLVAAVRELVRRGLPAQRNGRFRISPWQADHTVPLAEGGPLSAENLRTLCVPCHKRETAALAARLARARRPQQEIFG